MIDTEIYHESGRLSIAKHSQLRLNKLIKGSRYISLFFAPPSSVSRIFLIDGVQYSYYIASAAKISASNGIYSGPS